MRILFVFIFVFLNIEETNATGQVPDYLVIGTDTFPIFNNPLEQYFELGQKKHEIIGLSTTFLSTDCWRGYIAYWTLSNDSLFLQNITSCSPSSEEPNQANLFAMFGTNKPFAYWYSGTITAPMGEEFMSADMGYNAIYPNEKKWIFKNGLVQSQFTISNEDRIEQLKRNNHLYQNIPLLSDTLRFYISQLNWAKLDESYCLCSDSYLLTYDPNGRLLDVELVQFLSESPSIREKLYYWRCDRKCSRKIQSVLKQLSLDYLNPHRPFTIEITLFYDKSLEIWKCGHYFKTYSDAEVREHVKKLMEIQE